MSDRSIRTSLPLVPATLVLRNVRKAWFYGMRGDPHRRQVLRGCSIILGQGERVAIVAERGAGSTTLLLIASGVARPDSGVVIGPWQSGDGGLVRFVPTAPALPLAWTPRDAVAASVGSRWPLAANGTAAERALRLQGLSAHADTEFRRLPAAAAWRASVAAAQVAGARLILMDREPDDAAELQAEPPSLAVAEPVVFGSSVVSVVSNTRSVPPDTRVVRLQGGVLREVGGDSGTPCFAADATFGR